MKKFKKFFAFAMAMIMCLGMAVTASAATNTCTLKIDTAAGHTYKVYQLLTGDVSANGTTLSNVAVGSSTVMINEDGEVVEADGKVMTKEQIEAAVKDLSGIELSQKATDLVKYSTPVATIPGDGNAQTVKIGDSESSESIPTGYYVITDEYSNGTGTGVSTTLSATMVQLVANVTIEPKDTDVPTQPTKTIKGAVATVSIGDTLTYTLGGAIPSMANYESYKYVLVDTLDKGLAPANFVNADGTVAAAINVGNTVTVDLMKDGAKVGEATFEVTAKNTVTDTTAANYGETTVRFALQNAIQFKDARYTGAEFSFDYTATVTADADITGTLNPITNKVVVEFPNNPDSVGEGNDFSGTDPKGTTVETVVTVYTTQLTINKVDGNGDALTGAEFKLEGKDARKVGYVTGQEFVAAEDGTWYKLLNGSYTETAPTAGTEGRYENNGTVKYKLSEVNAAQYTPAQTEAQAFVDATGHVTFNGLGAGTYTITEVTTPNGYNTIAPIEITITFDESTKTFKVGDTEMGQAWTGYEVVNQSGSTLPSTGGIGTTIFYVVGGILVAGAGILLITKKRMSKEQ